MRWPRFDRFQALAGDWVDLDDAPGVRGKVAVTYRVTGGGSAVVETLFVGTNHEMVTVYQKEGTDLVLTHYCAMGNQPRMRSKTVGGNVVVFSFDGGTNLDPAKDAHVHSGRMEFMSPNEIRSKWQGWAGGKASDHLAKFRLGRVPVADGR